MRFLEAHTAMLSDSSIEHGFEGVGPQPAGRSVVYIAESRLVLAGDAREELLDTRLVEDQRDRIELPQSLADALSLGIDGLEDVQARPLPDRVSELFRTLVVWCQRA